MKTITINYYHEINSVLLPNFDDFDQFKSLMIDELMEMKKIYKQAIDEKWDSHKLRINSMELGLCKFMTYSESICLKERPFEYNHLNRLIAFDLIGISIDSYYGLTPIAYFPTLNEIEGNYVLPLSLRVELIDKLIRGVSNMDLDRYINLFLHHFYNYRTVVPTKIKISPNLEIIFQ